MKEEVTYFVMPMSGWIEFCVWAGVILLAFAVVLRVVEMAFNVAEGIQLNRYYRRKIAETELHIEQLNANIEALRKEIKRVETEIYRTRRT